MTLANEVPVVNLHLYCALMVLRCSIEGKMDLLILPDLRPHLIEAFVTRL